MLRISKLSHKLLFSFAAKPRTPPIPQVTTTSVPPTPPVKQEQAVKPAHPSAFHALGPNDVYLEYKKYPLYEHGDKKSKKYIPAERDEYNEETTVKAYNKIIDEFKHCIKTQEQVYKTLNTMDRPYLNGIPGVEKNISGTAAKEGYSPPQEFGWKSVHEPDDLSPYLRNEDRFLNQNVYYPKYEKMTHYDVTWEEEKALRPINPDFHPDKGFKYDVPVPYEERFPHVADRMGYPEILGTPFERLMRLEGDIYHPNFLDQPFVQIPTADPHPSLSFEEGEVIYENTKLLEWAKFWSLTALSTYAFLALFVPYNLLYKSHLFHSSAYDGLFLPYHNFSMYFFDNMQLHIPVVGGVAGYLTYACFVSFFNVCIFCINI